MLASPRRRRRHARLAALAVQLALIALVIATRSGAARAEDAGAAVAVPVTEPDAGSDPVTGSEPDAGSDPVTGSEPDAGSGPVTGSVSDAGAGAGIVDAGPGAGPHVKPPQPPPGVPAGVHDAATPPSPPPSPKDGKRAAVVIKLVLGFVLLFVVAYVGSHRKIVAAQERLGISGVIAAGFPFVALGVIVRQPEIGILTPEVVDRIRPILHFGLGWLGFIIGAQLDIRLLDRLPRGTAYLVVVEALAPFAVTAAACGACAVALGLSSLGDSLFWRDMILLGAAAAMTAPRRFRGFANRGWREGRGADSLLAQLDEIVGVVGLLFVAAYFRPTGAAGWQIPGTAWLFVTIGLGVVVGVLIFAMVRVPVSESEFLCVVLGSVALGSGLAGYLYLSPIVVCFIAGALVTNFPCEQRDQIFRILNHLERPIHLLFLIVAGALWDVTALAPWVIVPAFVAARIVGKWLGVFAARTTVGNAMPKGFADERVLVSPLSPLSIALVLSLHGSVGGAASDWIITVVIAGAIFTEIAVQFTSPPVPIGATSLPGAVFEEAIDAVDDLDKQSGPTYVDGAHDDDDEPLPPLAPRPRTKGGGA